MSQYSNYYVYNYGRNSYYPSFRDNTAPLAKPIEKVENLVNNTVDTFVAEDSKTEEEKKSRHTTVKVLSTGLVLGTLLLALNPKSSGKMMNKFQEWAKIAGEKAKDNNSYTGKIFKWSEKFFERASKWAQIGNNGNSFKDERFKYLCTQKKQFDIKNDTLRKICESVDDVFVKVMTKPHNLITKGFDSISKKTVHRKY